MSSIDVVYAANMKPGDLYAGDVNPDAPTRPVQTFAAAHKLASVERFRADDGRPWVRLRSASFELSPVPAVTQCLVIRP
jgi:hypothetical protein